MRTWIHCLSVEVGSCADRALCAMCGDHLPTQDPYTVARLLIKTILK